jgi:hypothetical protein
MDADSILAQSFGNLSIERLMRDPKMIRYAEQEKRMKQEADDAKQQILTETDALRRERLEAVIFDSSRPAYMNRPKVARENYLEELKFLDMLKDVPLNREKIAKDKWVIDSGINPDTLIEKIRDVQSNKFDEKDETFSGKKKGYVLYDDIPSTTKKVTAGLNKLFAPAELVLMDKYPLAPKGTPKKLVYLGQAIFT